MGSLVDEFTGSKAVGDLATGVLGSVRHVAKSNLGDVGAKLVDEVGGRVGLGVSNAGPDAVASLNATGRTGNPSPDIGSPHNAPRFDAAGWLKANWKIAGIVVVVAVVAWKFLRKRKG